LKSLKSVIITSGGCLFSNTPGLKIHQRITAGEHYKAIAAEIIGLIGKMRQRDAIFSAIRGYSFGNGVVTAKPVKRDHPQITGCVYTDALDGIAR
jgi:hypothetical protein